MVRDCVPVGEITNTENCDLVSEAIFLICVSMNQGICFAKGWLYTILGYFALSSSLA